MKNITTKIGQLTNMAKDAEILNTGTEHIILSKPGCLYGHPGKIILGYGTEFKISSDYEAYSADVPYSFKGAAETFVLSEGDILTNESKRPSESAAERMVTLALRRLSRKQKEIERASHELTRKQKEDRGQIEPDPEPIPDPEPTPEPQTPDNETAPETSPQATGS